MGCPVTVWPSLSRPSTNNRGTALHREKPCGQPSTTGSRLCVKHEADRARLSDPTAEGAA